MQINPNPKPPVTTPKWPTVTPKPKLKEVTNTPKNTRKTPPLCPCGRRAKRLYVQKHGPNHGRIFFTCTMKSINGKGCSFFQWDTSSDIGQSPAFRPPVKRSWICANLVVYLPWWAFLQNIFIYVYSKQVLHKKVNTILFATFIYAEHSLSSWIIRYPFTSRVKTLQSSVIVLSTEMTIQRYALLFYHIFFFFVSHSYSCT